VKILTDEQHRALAFIEGCNRSGYSPTRVEVDAWLKERVPPTSLTEALVSTTASWRELFGRGDTAEHMLKLGWLSDSPRLRLTDLGRALLGAADRAEPGEGEASIVVLDSEDPFAYARLIGHLAKAKQGLLVDPYFRIDQLMTVLNSTSIMRILVSKQHAKSKEDRAALAVALDSPSLPRTIEVRATNDPALHDRLIVGEDGEVWTLGASLNSLATTSTVIVPVPPAGAAALRQQVGALWDGAEGVHTTLPPEGDMSRSSSA
jgi:hypothetical protein